MAQQVKDLVSSLLWYRFNPWPGNFHIPRVRQKQKTKNKKTNKQTKKTAAAAPNRVYCGIDQVITNFSIFK